MNNMNNIYSTNNKDGQKPWYKSKTIWFNVITMLLGCFQLVNQTFPIPAQYLAYINAGGNLILRFITDTKLTSN